MTIAVDLGRKATKQTNKNQHKQTNIFSFKQWINWTDHGNQRFTFSNQAFNKSLVLIMKTFIALCITQIWLTAAKLTCPCNTLRTSNSFARSDTVVVIDSKPHMSRTCKTSLLFTPLAVRDQAGCSPFSFYTPTKSLMRLYFKCKTVLIPKLKMILIF